MNLVAILLEFPLTVIWQTDHRNKDIRNLLLVRKHTRKLAVLKAISKMRKRDQELPNGQT